MNDFELLREYAGRASEDAFTLLVNRYVNLVYSAAFRQAGDARDAEEITQAVFLILARKAGGMRRDTVLSGWLLRTTRFVTWNARRREMSRRQLEREAMNLYSTETDAAWKKISPILDEALVNLSEKDRAAVALRFFEEKSFKEIGQTMGLTEDGAQKRVSRAVEKLRADFARRGIALPAALITGAIMAGAVQAAPSHLAASVASAAFAGTAVTANALAKITLSAWEAARLKLLALQGGAVTLVVALIGVTAVHLNSRNVGSPTTTSQPAPMAARVATPLSPAIPETKPPEPAGGQTMRFHAVDAASLTPVTNARLTLVQTPGFLHRTTNIVLTDPEGMALLSVDRAAAGDWSARIEVFQDGYVPKFVRWSDAQGDSAADIPAEYATKLTRAVEIGGKVVNEAGEPVPGARVVFNARQLNGQTLVPEDSVDRECLTLGDHYHVEVTDRQGRWHCNHVPEQFGLIFFGIYHPDFVSATFGSLPSGGIGWSGSHALAAADFRNGTAIMPLARGVELDGVVVNRAGTPVAGAKVTANRNWAEPTASQLTGADGRFRFASSPRILTVQAQGYGPADMEIDREHPPAETRFVLNRGAVLRGVVADEKGQPVASAKVEVSGGPGAPRYEWNTVTDNNGKFEWLSAPASPESYFIQAWGYKVMAPVQLTADGTEQKVTLPTKPPRVRFFGNVTDAETGKAVDDFTVWMSTEEAAYIGYTNLEAKRLPLRSRAAGKAGEFSFTNSGDFVQYAVEVRAEGYRSSRVTGRGPVANDASFNFALQRGEMLSGIVLMPDGKPAAGAVAILCTEEPPQIPAQRALRGGRYMTTPPGYQSGGVMRFPREFDLGTRHVEADDQGRFSIPPEFGLKKVLFFNAVGFNCLSTNYLTGSPAVTLLPWGRVTGMLKIGSQVGANQRIDLSSPYMPYAEWSGYGVAVDTRTDAQGRFDFEGLPAGDMRISHRLTFHDGQTGAIPDTQETHIHVQAGETTQVTLGGTGWKVVGRVKLKGPEQPIDWRREVQRLDAKLPGPPAPDRKAFASAADYQAAVRQWQESEQDFLATEAGRQAEMNQRRYILEFDTEGSFKIDDVVPGTYELKIQVTDPSLPVPQIPDPRRAIGALTKVIGIPEIPAGADGSAFDLGELQLN